MSGSKKITKKKIVKKPKEKSIFDLDNVSIKPEKEDKPIMKPAIEKMKKEIEDKDYPFKRGF